MTKWISILLVFATLFAVTGCGNAAPDLLADGADRFAAGKPEENYYLKNSGALLDELIDKYSGSYYIPTSVQIQPGSIDPSDPSDPSADPDDTSPDDSSTDIPKVGSWDELLDVFYDTYSSTSEHMCFELVGGFTMNPSEDLNRIYVALQREDPIQVCSVTQWTWYTVGNVYYIDVTYSIDIPTLISMKAETELLVEEAAAKIDTAGKSDYEIICAVNDYLCDTVYYPPTKPYAPVTHTPYGALKDGVAVCEGYACAAKLMLNALGIRCDIQVGECTNGEGHAWNLVELDGNWYQMDITWNDGGGSREDYLLVDDAYMQKSRTWEYSDYPSCAINYNQ